MPPKTERRHRQGTESRLRILEAALAIAVERGYDGTTVALVCERAELPASSVYWQFTNKDDLLAEALDHSYRRWRLEGPTWQPTNYSGTPRDRITTRLGYSLSAVEREVEYWRLGLTLAMLRRPGGIAAQKRFKKVRGETRRIVEEWWADIDHEVAAHGRMATEAAALCDALPLLIERLGGRPRAEVVGPRNDAELRELAITGHHLAAPADPSPAAHRVEVDAEGAGGVEQIRAVLEAAPPAGWRENDEVVSHDGGYAGGLRCPRAPARGRSRSSARNPGRSRA